MEDRTQWNEGSVNDQVALQFPGGDAAAVIVPFLLFTGHILADDMLAHDFIEQGVLLEILNGLEEGFGQIGDATLLALLPVHVVDVFGDLGGRGQVAADTVQTGGQAGGHGQIGVAGGIGTTQLHAAALTAGSRNTDQRRCRT